jgi:CHASE2 domain-containing sensor protein/two-component sensor histidine kinase
MKQPWYKTIRARQYDLLPGIAAIGVVGLLKFFGHFQVWEWAVFDQMQRWQPKEPTDSRILLVGINEMDLQRVGAYPLPDRQLLTLLQAIQQQQPATIGLDLFRDLPQPAGGTPSDQAALTAFLTKSKNVIGIDKLLSTAQSPAIAAPPGLAPTQVGFVDGVLDRDGALRRSLLGAFDRQEQFRFSLTVLLAEQYLQTQGITLESGVRNPDAMRFGSVELPVFEPSTGGYVQADAGGVQTLIRFRAGQPAFRTVSMTDILAQRVPADWIRGKVVIVGMMAASAKDYVTSNAIASENPALIYGMEVQAHAVSQILAAVLDQRGLIQAWHEGWDYGWLVLWGGWGLVVGWWLKAPTKLLGVVLGSLVLLVAVGYGGMTMGWWIPIVPAMVAFLGNGVVLATVYRYHQMMQLRVTERQEVISLTFNAIHNGPLQTLATVLRQSDPVSSETQGMLQNLDRELREIYDAMRHAAQPEESRLYISSSLVVDLQEPLHEILPQIYLDVLARPFPGFASLKFKVLKFEGLAEQRLNPANKAAICRFFEEALCNVGKHAIAPTKLEIHCAQIEGKNRLAVMDNGQLQKVRSAGLGTKLAQKLAKRLRGQLTQDAMPQQGFKCELIWPG